MLRGSNENILEAGPMFGTDDSDLPQWEGGPGVSYDTVILP